MKSAALPKISLVTPNYNYGHFIESTIRSVLDQGYENLEYVILDGGSTDGSQAIIERYADRLAHWRSRRDEGQYATITEGLNMTSGEVMGWINSDDMHFPWTLRAVGSIFAAFPDVDWISTLRPATWDYTGMCVEIQALPGFSREAYLDGRFLPGARIPGQWVSGRPIGVIQQESTFWRRSLWEKVGAEVRREYGPAGDFDLWGRFYEHAELVGVAIPLGGFRGQYTQQSANIAEYTEHGSRSLRDARARAGWRPSLSRRVAASGPVRATPRLRAWALNGFGYTARLVRRTNPKGPEPGWELDGYRFP